MALIQTIGRSGKIVYGFGATTIFRVKFTTPYIKTPTGLIRQYDQPISLVTQDPEPYRAGGYDKFGALGSADSGGVSQGGIDQGSLTATPGSVFTPQTVSATNAVTAGTLTIAGTTVTLSSTDILTPQGVAIRIAATAITGYTVFSIRDQVYLTSTTFGHSARPVLALGTATNIQFYDLQIADGATFPATFDDIYIQGRTPVTVTLVSTGGSGPALASSTGTLLDQEAGTLVYTPLTLSSGVVTLTAPTNFITVSAANSATQITIFVTR